MKMDVGVVAIDRNQRKNRNQLQALPQHILDRNILRILVVGVEGKHAFRQRVHHVAARRLHHDVADKPGRQPPIVRQQLAEAFQLLRPGQTAEQQKIDRLLKAETILRHVAGDQILHIDSAVEQLAVAGHRLAVDHLVLPDFGNVRKAG